jgi:hypothetical protein
MVGGCRTVVADNSSLSEIAGPSIRVTATDNASIAKGIQQVLSQSPSEQKTQIERGVEWAKRFTWSSTVKGLMASYEKAVSR